MKIIKITSAILLNGNHLPDKVGSAKGDLTSHFPAHYQSVSVRHFDNIKNTYCFPQTLDV